MPSELEWVPEKGRLNRRKHGVDFADAVGAFEDPFGITVEDAAHSEHRWVTIGRDYLNRVIVVAWPERGDRVLLISELATPRERRRYAQGDDA